MGSGASQPKVKPTVYIFPISSPCRAVLMTTKAIGLEVNTPVINLLKGEQREAKFLKINPDHTVPTLVDGNVTLWESRAIMTYLIDRYRSGGCDLYPKDPIQRAQVDRFLYYDLETSSRVVGEYMRPIVFQSQRPNKEKEEEVKEMLKYLENVLKDRQYLAGPKLTIADISVTASLGLLEVRLWDFSAWPKVAEWRKRIEKEPWYAEANKGLLDYVKSSPIRVEEIEEE